MPLTDNAVYVSLQGEQYAINAVTAEKVRALLKRAKAKPVRKPALSLEERDYYLAEELFPELNDPVMGPANYLRGIRRREKLTQTELAKKAGMKQHHISEMESGKRTITKAAAKKLAAVLNTDWRRMI